MTRKVLEREADFKFSRSNSGTTAMLTPRASLCSVAEDNSVKKVGDVFRTEIVRNSPRSLGRVGLYSKEERSRRI